MLPVVYVVLRRTIKDHEKKQNSLLPLPLNILTYYSQMIGSCVGVLNYGNGKMFEPGHEYTPVKCSHANATASIEN